MMNFIFKTGNERKVEPKVILNISEKFINDTNKNTNMYMKAYTNMYMNINTMLHKSTKLCTF